MQTRMGAAERNLGDLMLEIILGTAQGLVRSTAEMY